MQDHSVSGQSKLGPEGGPSGVKPRGFRFAKWTILSYSGGFACNLVAAFAASKAARAGEGVGRTVFRTSASEYFGGHRVDGAGAWSGGLGGIFSAGCIADSFAGASWAIGISSGSGISSRLSCSDRDFCRRSSSCWARAKERSRRTCACQIRSRMEIWVLAS